LFFIALERQYLCSYCDSEQFRNNFPAISSSAMRTSGIAA